MGIANRKDNIEHIDTCIMIRMITRDNEKMLKKARKLFSQKEKIYIFEDAAMMASTRADQLWDLICAAIAIFGVANNPTEGGKF